MSNTKEITMVNNLYTKLNQRHRKTTLFYTILNIIIYCVGAGIIVLNIFAIRKNDAQDSVKWLFVIVAILTAITTFLSSVISFFVFRKKNKTLNEKIRLIKIEQEQHKNRVLEYEVENADAVLVDQVTRILNK